ncbi:leukocyte elastase inhibitor-like isoform X3 [Lampris incognitus]|nr:leukocyte elastase inhibitor-like isoform X3 [Lampris incognitus]
MASSTPLSEANTTFSLDLLKKLTEEKKTGNVFYSPLSISSALAMVMLGARGNTATQMSEVLCFSKAEKPRETGAEQMQMQQQVQISKLPLHLLTASLQLQKAEGDVHVGFAKLMSELNRPGTPYSLSLANRLYGEQSYQFVEEFLGETRKHYNAELVPVDFRTNSERARVDINTWVEKQTQDKIKNLLKKGIVDEMTRLVLVNAIYFKGNWDKQFKADLTSDSTFRLNKNETKTVKMMYQKGKFPLTFIPEVNCQILEMPYTGKDLSMVIILPNDMEDNTTGLEKIESKLTYESFVDWTRPDMMDKIEVKVGLPRFKMEETYDMNAILTSMGMRDAFDQRCSDFSGMSTANDLVLSTVVHKAFVEVNEEGTEAAAATAAVMMTRSSRMPAAFIADHPFLFFIRHNSSSSILFAGRYCSPA